ncbi:hypothetical protein MLD38_019779 [Melastoma candidum]|nr:hypothetical protein MLD38_019779 [Melastoma candidum]
MEDARYAFKFLPRKNVITWNTLITGYVHLGEQAEAMKLLHELFHEGFHPDQSTLAGVISSFGILSSISGVTHLHALAIKVGIVSHISVSNSLISAYSKCGSIGSASRCFMLVEDPDIVTWSSIISGYGFHGMATETVRAFQRMLFSGIRPDNIAFLGVISSCAHAGMVHEGLHYFDLMISKYGLTPNVEQYACLIDIATRAGLLKKCLLPEAERNTLGAILGASAARQSAIIDAQTLEEIFLSEAGESANYTLISNLYASEGKWGEVARVRKMMRINCGFKVPGISWIEITGTIHTFVSSDKSHPETIEIYAVLSLVFWELNNDQDSD